MTFQEGSSDINYAPDGVQTGEFSVKLSGRKTGGLHISVHHHILTRFNLRTSTSYSDAWFRRRLELFERYTLPSLLVQKNKDFTWHLLFDAERTAPHLGRLERLGLQSANARCHFLSADEKLRDALQTFVTHQTGPVLTSRIDNDDILHPMYVERLHDAARSWLETGSSKPVLLDFRTNYMWTHEQKKMVRRRVSYPSAFTSLLESSRPETGFKTVFASNHARLHKQFKLIKLPFEGGIAVVHGENILNETTLHPNFFRRWQNKLRGKANWVAPRDIAGVLSSFRVAHSLDLNL